MSDFSAAAMFLVIREGLKQQGLKVPVPPQPSNAHIPLADKRSLLDMLERQFGHSVLLRLGNAVHGSTSTPALVPLALAKDPEDLIRRWQRLEKFVHSRHRTDFVERSDGRLVLAHVAKTGSQPPTSAEDLLIFGLLTALMKLIGALNIRARPAGAESWAAENDVWADDLTIRKTAQWEFRWDGMSERRSGVEPNVAPADWMGRARMHLASDPGHKWTLGALARVVGTSARSLQRRLQEEQSSFSNLLTQVRASAASELLSTSDHSPAEIGYVCGYSDQAHFTRDFKRCTAFTPVCLPGKISSIGRLITAAIALVSPVPAGPVSPRPYRMVCTILHLQASPRSGG